MPPLSALRVRGPLYLLAWGSPPAAGNSCPTTAGSRSCTDSGPGRPQTARSTRRRSPPRPCSPSPLKRFPDRPLGDLKRLSRAQFRQPARRPGHHLCQPDSARRRHASIHQDHQSHPTAEASPRIPRRLPPTGLPVGSKPHHRPQNPRSTHTRRPVRGNFGLDDRLPAVGNVGVGSVEDRWRRWKWYRSVDIQIQLADPGGHGVSRGNHRVFAVT